MKITQDLVKEWFSYDNSTGKLYWNKNSGSNLCKGKVAGVLTNGYVRVSWKGKRIYAHRLVYLYHKGYIPDVIDHVNGVKDDNRIENLRSCTQQENCMNCKIASNNSTGVKGVSWNKQHKKYKGIVQYKGKQYFAGYFNDLDSASDAVRGLRATLHTKFLNHG